MTVRRAARWARVAVRWALPLAVLCLACGAFAAIAFAATRPAHASRRLASHTARQCHRTPHRRRCPSKRAGGSSHEKHTRQTGSKPSTTGGATGGSGASATGPGGTSTGSGGTAATESNGGAPTGNAPAAPAAPAHVEVTAQDSEGFRFVLSRPSVPAGKTIIEFVNHGQDEHNLNAAQQNEGTVAGSLPNTLPNAHPSLTVNLRRGSYTLFCSLPGHEAGGMKATLVVN